MENVVNTPATLESVWEAFRESDKQRKEVPVYITVDGSMVYTREEGWKEMKVGRIYCENSRVAVQDNRTEVTDSLYACTLDNNKDFFKKFELYVEPYKHKVFIADGAIWIWNWVEDFYGNSVQILDFYHAVEKLGTYATLAYKNVTTQVGYMIDI